MATLEYGTGTAVNFSTLYTNDLDIAGLGEDDIRAAVLADAQLHIADVTRATPTRPVLAGKNGRVYVGYASTPADAPKASKASPAQAAATAPVSKVGKTVAPQPVDVDKTAALLFAYGAFDTLDAAREAVVAKQEARKAKADALLAQMDDIAQDIKAREAELADARSQYAALQAQLADLGRQP